jgi:hypothetical protein
MTDENKPEEPKKGKTRLTAGDVQKQVEAGQAETDERLTAMESTMGDLEETVKTNNESVNTQLEQILKAVNNPVSISKDGANTDDATHVEQDRQFARTDSPHDEVNWMETSRVTDVHAPEFIEKAEQMRFDQEIIEVFIQPSQAQFPDNTFTITVNGRPLIAIRGVKQKMPRNYVEVMARAKMSTFGNIETVEASTGERVVKNPETKSHRYSFMITGDPNHVHGPHWQERVLNERAA